MYILIIVVLIIYQESYFHWSFGVLEPDCFGAIRVGDGLSILFVPRLPDDHAVWMGKIPALDDYKKRYEVDEVFYVDQVSTMSDVLFGRFYVFNN